ncbi:hypothetical protein PC129_g20863 [Phytophthora cactorum]|uniref:DDE-1 domain-containing protein n=1 Tax=Phytophthora cactorum TaxID=29920 RepID=A0A329SD69_9STRA|nr:hypothetical protein Pcac1_g11482 [Phytophthora cactorum]KAG2803519.1 hypothetical protein PC112_g19136 [Phytophthora cactorum]KAG2824610.1 hypothetical protein PC111_g9751 [Phytophthora cactorum]KAG2925951.1 hypothetical protein PC117_g15030 [Phytophthora cactorum]KAG3000946.1 hypothetical protein PC120_g20571 [Phytophthora cactorum]
MTTCVFEEWLKDVNSSMKKQERNILLLVDNAPSHCADGVSLSNVCLEKLQPLDQGIIYCLKRDVLTRKMLHTLDEMDAGNNKPYKVGMLKGIEWCAEAWQDLPAQAIEHCWLHSGLTSKADLSFVLN